jgi:PIN domain nuclease of toxin-antitoxin system
LSDRPLLLDTHALLWITRGDVSAEAIELLDGAAQRGVQVLVSPISAWEVSMMVARGRLTLPMSPQDWFAAAIDEGLAWAPLTPEVLMAAPLLPGRLPRDPADRIIVATARAFGYRLVTRDRGLLDYAAGGHMLAVAC